MVICLRALPDLEASEPFILSHVVRDTENWLVWHVVLGTKKIQGGWGVSLTDDQFLQQVDDRGGPGWQHNHCGTWAVGVALENRQYFKVLTG